MTQPTVIDWLLDADPSIRWQMMRDLTHQPADVIVAERSRVATQGCGATLLALQAPDGLWGGRPFSQDRTDTFHVLELLRRFGLDPESKLGRPDLFLAASNGDGRAAGGSQVAHPVDLAPGGPRSNACPRSR